MIACVVITRGGSPNGSRRVARRAAASLDHNLTVRIDQVSGFRAEGLVESCHRQIDSIGFSIDFRSEFRCLYPRLKIGTVSLLTAPGGGPGCLPGSQPFAGPRTEHPLNSTRLLKAYTKGPGTFDQGSGAFLLVTGSCGSCGWDPHDQSFTFLEDGRP